MKSVSMTEFNQHPSRVAKLAADDEVVVLRHGRAVLKITSLRGDGPEDRVQELVRAGLARPPRARDRDVVLPVVGTDADLDALLEADRGRLDG